MSAREQILAFLEAHQGDQRTADIAAACECTQGAVYTALSGLTATGEITRVDTGVYRLTGATKAPKAETKPARSETKAPEPVPPVAESEEPTEPAVDDDPIEVPRLSDEDIRRIWNGMGSFLDSREADNQSFARAVESEVRRRMGVVE